MKYKVKITLNAKNDIKEAVSYYESRRDGLGKEFLTAFKLYKELISDIVTARMWYKSMRGFPM